MSKLDATVTVFTVNPIADPARGGRWVSIQLWADQGTVNVRQVSELKSRLLTPETRDPEAEIHELTRALLAVARESGVYGVPRRDAIVLDTVTTTEV